MILIRPTVRGGTELAFPSGDTRAGTVLMCFSVLLAGGIWYVSAWPVGFLLAMLHFGLLPCFLLVIALKFWFGKETVTIENGTVTFRSGVLGIRWTRHILCMDIAEVKMVKVPTCYEVRVVCRDGLIRRAATCLRNQEDAVATVAEIKRAVGINR
jgi:hypothetical protein